MSKSSAFTRKRREPAHRAQPASRMRFATVGGILTSTAIIGGGALLGLASVGGTYALWTDSGDVAGISMDSGSMSVRVGDGSTWSSSSTAFGIDTSQVGSMFPGDFEQSTLEVEVDNSGSHLSSDINIRTTAPVPAGFEINVAPAACSGELSGHVIDDTQDVSLGSWGSVNILPICVQISVPRATPSSLQGASSGEIEFIITAKQQEP